MTETVAESCSSPQRPTRMLRSGCGSFDRAAVTNIQLRFWSGRVLAGRSPLEAARPVPRSSSIPGHGDSRSERCASLWADRPSARVGEGDHCGGDHPGRQSYRGRDRSSLADYEKVLATPSPVRGVVVSRWRGPVVAGTRCAESLWLPGWCYIDRIRQGVAARPSSLACICGRK